MLYTIRQHKIAKFGCGHVAKLLFPHWKKNVLKRNPPIVVCNGYTTAMDQSFYSLSLLSPQALSNLGGGGFGGHSDKWKSRDASTNREIALFEWCLNRDRTLDRAILVHLTPGCQNETLDVAGKEFLYRYSWRNCLTRTADFIWGRSTAVLFNIWKLVWSTYLFKNWSQIEGKIK